MYLQLHKPIIILQVSSILSFGMLALNTSTMNLFKPSLHPKWCINILISTSPISRVWLVYMGITAANLFPFKVHIVHMDLRGPMRHITLGVARYVSRAKFGFNCFKPKQKHSLGLKNGCLVDTKISKKVQKIRSNNGGKLILHAFGNCFLQRGIACQFLSSNYKQNGVVNREKRTVQEMA